MTSKVKKKIWSSFWDKFQFIFDVTKCIRVQNALTSIHLRILNLCIGWKNIYTYIGWACVFLVLPTWPLWNLFGYYYSRTLCPRCLEFMYASQHIFWSTLILTKKVSISSRTSVDSYEINNLSPSLLHYRRSGVDTSKSTPSYNFLLSILWSCPEYIAKFFIGTW